MKHSFDKYSLSKQNALVEIKTIYDIIDGSAVAWKKLCEEDIYFYHNNWINIRLLKIFAVFFKTTKYNNMKLQHYSPFKSLNKNYKPQIIARNTRNRC